MAVIQQVTAAQAAGASLPPWADCTFTIDGGDGNLHFQIVTGKAARWQTNDAGSCQITMTHSGARNVYLCILAPTGVVVVSDVIAFT